MEKILLTSFLELYTLSNDKAKWSVANFAKNHLVCIVCK